MLGSNINQISACTQAYNAQLVRLYPTTFQNLCECVPAVYIAVIENLQHVILILYHGQLYSKLSNSIIPNLSIPAHSITLIRVCIGCLHFVIVDKLPTF